MREERPNILGVNLVSHRRMRKNLVFDFRQDHNSQFCASGQVFLPIVFQDLGAYSNVTFGLVALIVIPTTRSTRALV